ncbi:hydroxysqualene dehydroxylase HpnE [Methylobacterium isbiliense]|jgi:squalene-associated FAD-dependent desaturase|uniref:Hydroxysqualene dehydroxylase n=1 Tax=Methylobacterium isbiliense TaxID=315478 RepID=A0ABQ4SB20_9HYPH|nr:hydroxysqualene dehydroxylase HpnE [Methylobacterium isbiliense]MDN3626934.1 hydroxysqualene dehydroxylase HpnE [Methylobacterium isbiliense]GJD99347.1 Hydroxysqualene dehydroxylase [Methylobacterium isbiliense]
MTGTVHVVGAGLAGLSAAVRLVEAGRRVIVHEAAKQAGGRCRSYFDPALGLTIDNGNHLLLSGNRDALDFLAAVGAPADALTGPAEAAFPFADLDTGERWTLRPNAGRLPWWVLDARRRVPGSRARDYLAPLGLFRAGGRAATIGESMACEGLLWERLWHPVLLAALNTEPRESDAGLAAAILRETLGAGGRACRPLVAVAGLSAAFVDPALRHLAQRGADIRFGRRLRALDRTGSAVARLDFGDAPETLGPDDAVVLALPAWVAADLIPGLAVPQAHRSIVNAHFAVAPPPGTPLLLGVVGGVTEWLFAYPDRLSVTISGADRLLDVPREDLAQTIWGEVARLTGQEGAPLPRWQIVKEKRATFAATPQEAARRPGARTHLANLALAGDWTATGLPSTIEGAIRSGATAASVVVEDKAALRGAA